MIRKSRKILSILLALVMVTGALSSVTTLSFADVLKNMEGSISTNAYYTFYDDNVLVITATETDANGNLTGSIDDFAAPAANSDPSTPWAPYYMYSTPGIVMGKIIIANGIKRIGNYAFYMKPDNNYKVNLINLADSLKEIGAHAFENQKEITSITIPQNVTLIDTDAFSGCTKLKTINCYADPESLRVESSTLADGCKIHVKADKLNTYQTRFSDYKAYFVGDLTEPTNLVPAGKNILVSYEDPSPSILAGALPYSIKNVNTKGTWPITYGARGFVTCVSTGSKESGFTYYALADNNNGILRKIEINSTSGKAMHLSEKAEDIFNNVSLKISHEYIGANSIKMIYTVTNNTNTTQSFSFGSSGDIKIGQDDKATITPLTTNSSSEIGITMTSNKDDDKVGDDYPTLGFAAKEVSGSDAATYFYGKVNATKGTAATAVKSDIFIPERIFTKNEAATDADGQSKETGGLTGLDSGLSFYWNVSLPASEEKQYAVIFSVPNTASDAANSTVINEVKSNISTDDSTFYKTSNPVKTIVFNNEIVPKGDDVLAANNNFSTLKNFLILGVQKKPEMTQRNCIRFVSVVNTDILKDADEYGYLLAKTNRETATTYTDLRDKIKKIEYGGSNIYQKNIKGTDNQISGDYGLYDTNTPYKYITLGINDVPDDVVFIARFYVKKGDKIQYADYYNSANNRYDGCSIDWQAVNAASGFGH